MALVDLLNRVTAAASVEARLLRECGPDRLRWIWINAFFESVDGVLSAVVHEHLASLALPYSSDIFDSQATLARHGEAEPTNHPGSVDQVARLAGALSGSTGGRRTPLSGQIVLVGNHLGNG